MRREDREALRGQVQDAARSAAQIWPLRTFAYRNPVRGYEHLPFDEAVRAGSHLIGGAGYLPNSKYRTFLREGRITEGALRKALERVGPRVEPESVQADGRTISSDEVLWAHLTQGLPTLDRSVLRWTASEHGRPELLQGALAVAESLGDKESATGGKADLPDGRTLSDWLDTLTDSGLVDSINEQMVKWSAAFLDEQLAGWGMPFRDSGFYRSWRAAAAGDRTGWFLGIGDFARKVRALPDSPEEALAIGLETLKIPRLRWEQYQSRMFGQLPGWAGFVRWRSENPGYPSQGHHPIDLVQYLAVRMFYEVQLVDASCRERLGIEGNLPAVRAHVTREGADPADANVVASVASRLYHLALQLGLTSEQLAGLSPDVARAVIGWLDRLPEDRHGPIWLEAYEDAYRQRLVTRLAAHRGKGRALESRPLAQLVFCIDARSEPFRRHLEEQGPYETFGYAGFFGIPISHMAFDGDDRLALCPVLLKPGRSVDESVRPGEERSLERYASGTRWDRLGHGLFHDLKQSPIGSYMLVDALGFLFSIPLAGRTLLNRPYARLTGWLGRRFRTAVKTHMAVAKSDGGHDIPAGFTLEEQAAFVENGLRMIGLTARFGRLVVACGHGAASENNPYAAAYNCGACGGAHGDPNARAFTAMANDPDVRRVIASHGLEIPEDVLFVAAKHDTTTDRISFYDVDDWPASHAEDMARLQRDLVTAGSRQASERIGKLPRAPVATPPGKASGHALGRSVDWANPRPEWGLSSNAAFLIGRRALTKGLNLESRVFLHSYDPDADNDGGILERIMTAPLVVGEWINMEYYFSSVDPWVYGSGSKVIHNVVSGVGVMLGSQGDLQGGLPLQGVRDGARPYHEPMRLLAIIEAPLERISALIQKHEVLQTLFHNQWVNLLALEPKTFEFHRFSTDSRWERLAAGQVG